eukprot:gene19513-26185_t
MASRSTPAQDRMQILSQHMAANHSPAGEMQGQVQLSMVPCKGAVKSLPRFDANVLESYIDDMRDVKKKLYDMFKARPELLPAAEEGLSKEEHRSLVRRQLMAMLELGVNPLDQFNNDYKKYFYTAECVALVDLSLMIKTGVQYSLWGGRWGFTIGVSPVAGPYFVQLDVVTVAAGRGHANPELPSMLNVWRAMPSLFLPRLK